MRHQNCLRRSCVNWEGTGATVVCRRTVAGSTVVLGCLRLAIFEKMEQREHQPPTSETGANHMTDEEGRTQLQWLIMQDRTRAWNDCARQYGQPERLVPRHPVYNPDGLTFAASTF
jgi:hypothetical protein